MTNPRAAQLVEAGMWLRLSGDHEGAKRLFDQALKLDPGNVRARQLLDAATDTAPAAPPPAAVPEPPPSNPFAAPPTTTAMDLDWGSATGFAPTPIPFIPPVEFRPAAPTAPAAPPQEEELELPVELDIESGPPVYGDEVSGTLVFGRGEQSGEVPAPAPTVPEHWANEAPSAPTMMFQKASVPAEPTEALPWAAPMFGEDDDGPADTMQFAKPGEPAQDGGGTMQFARPSEPMTVTTAQSGGGTMQFPRPGEPEPSGSGTMQFAQPSLSPDDIWGEVASSPSSVFAIPAVTPVGLVPSPSPSEPRFAPNATSAWDQRSNPGIKLTEVAPGMGSALDLVSADRPAASPPAVKSKLDEVRTLVRGAKDLLNLDDHTGAMDLILKAQELAPNDPEVQALRTKSENTLEAMFESKLGKMTSAPRVKLKDDEIIWLNLDHRAGFVLAQIDGQCTFEDLFSVSGMSRLDTARILAQLIEEGVITS